MDNMMASTTMNPIAVKAHRVFAAVAGTPIVDDVVAGLSVNTDSTTPSMDLDLFPVEGVQLKINPAWGMSVSDEELHSFLVEAMAEQLP